MENLTDGEGHNTASSSSGQDCAPIRASLGGRGRELLAAIRADSRAAAARPTRPAPGTPDPAGPPPFPAPLADTPAVATMESSNPTDPAAPPGGRAVSLAYVVAADDNIDSELAGLALARRLVGPAAGQDDGVALLMLDPLGATLRLCKPRPPGPGEKGTVPFSRTGEPGGNPSRPQYRVANRGDWPDLLARLPERTRMILVLDTTGQQHRLTHQAGAVATVIVLAAAGVAGRVAAYRKLKELDLDGVGELGVFYARDTVGPGGRPGDADDFDDEDGLENLAGMFSSTGELQPPPSNFAPPPGPSPKRIPLFIGDSEIGPGGEAGGPGAPVARPQPSPAEQAEADFVRLASAVGQFLGRQLTYFGLAADIAAEGQPGGGQPGGQQEGQPDRGVIELLGQRPSIDGHENRSGLTRWLAENSRPLQCQAHEKIRLAAAAAELAVLDAQGARTNDQCPMTNTQEPRTSTQEPITDNQEPITKNQMPSGKPSLPVTAPTAPAPPVREHVAHPPPGVIGPQPGAAVPQPSPAAMPVVAVAAWPADEGQWTELLTNHPELVAGDLAILDFRPPADTATILAAAPTSRPGRLLLIRPVSLTDPLSAAAGLLDSARWARQHWTLLRLAYPKAALAPEPAGAIELALFGEQMPDPLRAIAMSQNPPVRLLNALRLDLSAVGGRLGVTISIA